MSNLTIYRKELIRKGINHFVRARAQKFMDILNYKFVKNYRNKRTFTFRNKNYRYLIHKYNYAWKNERTVEVPIVWNDVKKIDAENVLEVGNVLSHYFNIKHDVIDKYEVTRGVINEDVVSYKPRKKYDLIIAISTLEHVGWEEKPKEPLKILRALANLKSLLKKNGKIIVTLPIGYHNPQLNKLIKEKKLGFSQTYYMKRVSRNNKWIESNLDEVRDLQYNKPFPNSNALLVGLINAAS